MSGWVQAPGAQVSVVVIGVSNSSQTKLGMIAKTELESAPMPGLEPIYFCETAREMDLTLAELRDALHAFDAAELTQISGAPELPPGPTRCGQHCRQQH